MTTEKGKMMTKEEINKMFNIAAREAITAVYLFCFDSAMEHSKDQARPGWATIENAEAASTVGCQAFRDSLDRQLDEMPN